MIKKITLIFVLIINTLLLSGCFPVVQGAGVLASAAIATPQGAISVASTAISIANDRRSTGKILDDRTLSISLNLWMLGDNKLEDAHLNFMIYDNTVLITGEVNNKALQKYIIKQIQSKFSQIQHIFNGMTVGNPSSLLSRASDSAISIQANMLLLGQEVFHPTHINIMTENKVIYLMGAVTKREADKAVKVVSKAKGVEKVVKLFSYLKNRPAEEIQRERERAMAAQIAAQLKAKKEVNIGTDFSPDS